MTHRKDPHGRGRIVHYDTAILFRRYFTLGVIAASLSVALPPLIIPFAILGVILWRRERRIIAARRPSTREQVLARGRREI